MSSSLFVAAAFVTGALIPLQLAFNAQLGDVARSPFVAGLVVFLIGIAALALVVAIVRPAMPSLADMAVAPKTAWLGGVIATAYSPTRLSPQVARCGAGTEHSIKRDC